MPIQATERSWILQTEQSAYALAADADGRLVHCYWGPLLQGPEDYVAPRAGAWPFAESFVLPEEYPSQGGIKYSEACLQAAFADGTRDVVLRFHSAEVSAEDPELLTVVLRDTYYPLSVHLRYRVHPRHNLIERMVTLCNDGDLSIELRRVWSAQWHLPHGDDYRLSHLAGRWSGEGTLIREPLTRGVKRLESRRLTTSHHHAPYFALDRGAAEEAGEVWFGTLAWSGNWVIAAEVTDTGDTRLAAGLNDWDFAWRLDAGQEFSTPACLGGFSAAGFGAASRALHAFVREQVLPHGAAPHKVLYNSWEATTFQVDEQSQAQLAELAAAMGVELFVMDDGWFHSRAADNAGLGDWWPDAGKFPNGLGSLIARVRALGMLFGLWIEPEMVNRDSDLYRAHPDWVIHFPTRDRSEARNQLILNLGRVDVQDYLLWVLDRLLSENAISFIKWDMNRNVSEPGWPEAPADAREIWVRYVHGLYAVWQGLRDRHPEVVFQSCSGGGGRADYAILRLADQVWVSDNTDATARLGIQEGYSQLFPAATMEAWVTDVGRGTVPLAFRFHVAMCGVLGVGGHLGHWSEEERLEAAHWIALYKEIRHLVQDGEQYRLWSAQAHPYAAIQYVSADKAEGVVFVFRLWMPYPATLPVLCLRGLAPEGRYSVDGQAGPRSGSGWMHAGMEVNLGNLESTVLRIHRL